MLTLYHSAPSVCSQKVRVGLAHMGLEYEGRLLDLQAGDQFAPDYRRLNPDAVVPTLIDADLVLVESSLILAHLDRAHNGGRLMPADPGERARSEHWLLRCLAIHGAINTLTFATTMRQAILASKTEAEIVAHAARMPDPIMAAKRLDLIRNGLASAYVGQAMLHLRRLLNDLQAQLSPWMAGAAPGIVDIALVAYVDRLDRLGLSGLWDARFPRVGAWLEAWQATEAYARGITDFMPEGSAAGKREAGRGYWEEIEKAWRATA